MRVCLECHGNLGCEEKHPQATVHCGRPCGVCGQPRTDLECFCPAAREIESFNRTAQAFVLRMRARFIENMHKGGWQDIAWSFAFKKLCEEVGELAEPLMAFPKGYIELPMIQDEAADVGNFALFVYNKAAQEESTNRAIAKRTDELLARAKDKP